jgi:hypothetical protein
MKKLKINSYTNDDVNTVLKTAFENALADRDNSLELFEIIRNKIVDGDPEGIFLLSTANNLMDTITKQNDLLVKLAGVMQRLQTNVITSITKQNQLSSDEYKKLLEDMDHAEQNRKKIERTKEEIVSVDTKKLKIEQSQ